MEAAVVGIPMIASNAKGGINEIINNKNGIIFNNSSEDLAKNIKELLEHSYDREIIRTDATIRFDIDIIANKYTYFFNKLLLKQ